jgi:hypothetical protein
MMPVRPLLLEREVLLAVALALASIRLLLDTGSRQPVASVDTNITDHSPIRTCRHI